MRKQGSCVLTGEFSQVPLRYDQAPLRYDNALVAPPAADGSHWSAALARGRVARVASKGLAVAAAVLVVVPLLATAADARGGFGGGGGGGVVVAAAAAG